MAIYHCNSTVINRSSSRSSVGSSAYISGNKIVNERDGVVHDYTRKKGVVYSEIMLCDNAPKEWEDSSKLWNAVEKVENGNGQPCRIIEVALPKELDTKENIELTREYVRETFVKKGMCAEFAIHNRKDGNPHAHIMLTMRPVDENGKWENKTEKVYICKNHQGEEKEFTARELKTNNGEWEKQLPYYKNGNVKSKPVYLTKYEKEHEDKYKDYERVKGKNNPKKSREDRSNPKVAEWNSEEAFKEYRKSLATVTNKHLEEKGLKTRIDHRSYEEQGKKIIPTIHIGSYANQIERRGEHSRRGNINREIKLTNEQVEKIKKEYNEKVWERAKLVAAIKKSEREFEQKEPEKKEPLQDVQVCTMSPLEQQQQASQLIKCIEKKKNLESQFIDAEYQYNKARSEYEKINKQYNNARTYYADIRDYDKQYDKLAEQRERLGIFKLSQKKEIDRKMEEVLEFREKACKEASKVLGDKIKGCKKLDMIVSNAESDLKKAQIDIASLEEKSKTIQEQKEKIMHQCEEIIGQFKKNGINHEEVIEKLKRTIENKEQQENKNLDIELKAIIKEKWGREEKPQEKEEEKQRSKGDR